MRYFTALSIGTMGIACLVMAGLIGHEDARDSYEKNNITTKFTQTALNLVDAKIIQKEDLKEIAANAVQQKAEETCKSNPVLLKNLCTQKPSFTHTPRGLF